MSLLTNTTNSTTTEHWIVVLTGSVTVGVCILLLKNGKETFNNTYVGSILVIAASIISLIIGIIRMASVFDPFNLQLVLSYLILILAHAAIGYYTFLDTVSFKAWPGEF